MADDSKDPSKPGADPGKRAIFRIPPTALVAALVLLACMLPVAGAAPGLQLVLALPVVLGAWIIRTRTTATRQGLTVRTFFGTRDLPWAALQGLTITPKSRVQAVLTDGSRTPLPSVRARHLPVLSLVSEGRLADPSGILDSDPEPEVAQTSQEGTGNPRA